MKESDAMSPGFSEANIVYFICGYDHPEVFRIWWVSVEMCVYDVMKLHHQQL